MKIEEYNQDITSEMKALLLSADPDENSILTYLPTSKILVCHEKKSCIAIALLSISEGSFELKNLAVAREQQGRGIAKSMIERVKQLAKESGAVNLNVGTGNSSINQLALYQKCGFRMFRIERGYFDSYPEAIYENGIHCTDMVYLRAEL